MRVLAISSAYGGALACLVKDGLILARGRIAEEHGLAAALPAMVAGLLKADTAIDLVAMVVGPGSFTGLRGGLSVAAGIALGYGVPAVGVSVAEALAEEAARSPEALSGRVLWIAVQARRGRVFIDVGGRVNGPGFTSYAIDALPKAQGLVAVGGNAANIVASTLAARGTDVMLTALRMPQPLHVCTVALRRLAGGLPALSALPLYVDAPEAKPASGLRPVPGPPS